MNNEPFFIESSTKITFPTQKVCNSCYISILPEMKEFQTKRSTLNIEKSDRRIIFDTKCKDIT
ncbi:MAG: hypothetical protein ACOC4M_13755, partial [Promethearchaeia archaeon]